MSDLTGRQYRDALAEIRLKAPHAEGPIVTHVNHLTRLLAAERAERPLLEARIREAATLATKSTDESTDFLVVTADGAPATMTSTAQIVEQGHELARELLQSNDDIAKTLTTWAIRNGPLDGAICSIALHVIAERVRPVAASLHLLGMDLLP